MSSEYFRTRGVVNKRGRGKTRGGIVTRMARRRKSRVVSWAGCPGWKKDCLKFARTGVGVSTRIYDSNSLGDRSREGPGSDRRHVGTGEGISARIHVANSHIETGPKRVEETIASTAQIHCGRGMIPACLWGPA